MKRSFYKCLLWLHPAGFRDRFADEMLWIFDETGGQGPRPFTDVLISLLRQWTFHPGVWRIAFGALVSCLLLAGWWHFQEAALAAAFRRGNPGALKEIKHRPSSGRPCAGASGDVPAAEAKLHERSRSAIHRRAGRTARQEIPRRRSRVTARPQHPVGP